MSEVLDNLRCGDRGRDFLSVGADLDPHAAEQPMSRRVLCAVDRHFCRVLWTVVAVSGALSWLVPWAWAGM